MKLLKTMIKLEIVSKRRKVDLSADRWVFVCSHILLGRSRKMSSQRWKLQTRHKSRLPTSGFNFVLLTTSHDQLIQCCQRLTTPQPTTTSSKRLNEKRSIHDLSSFSS